MSMGQPSLVLTLADVCDSLPLNNVRMHIMMVADVCAYADMRQSDMNGCLPRECQYKERMQRS